MSSREASFKSLFKAIKSFDFYEESVVSLELFFGFRVRRRNSGSMMKFWVSFSMIFAVLALCIAKSVTAWKGTDTMAKIDSISPTCQIIVALMVYKLGENALIVLLGNLEKRFWKPSSFRGNFKNYLLGLTKRITSYVYTYKAFVLITTIQYSSKPITSNEPLIIYEFCDFEETSCFVPAFVLQVYFYFVIATLFCAFDGLFTAFILGAFEQLKMIEHKIENIDFVVEMKDDKILGNLADIVSHHAFILNFIDQLNKLYSPILLSQFGCTICSLCIETFLVTLNGKPSFEYLLNFIFYLVTISSQIFLYCFAGQILINQCEAITSAIYNTNWWNTNIKVRKTILMMLTRSQKIGHLSIGGFTEVNLRAYLYVSKTAFSFYTLVNQVYEGKKDI